MRGWIPPTLDETIKQGVEVFCFDFDVVGGETHKADLCKKILDEYLFDRLSCMPVVKWLQRFRTKFLLELPYYNDLFESAFLKFDPFLTHDSMQEVFDELASTNKHAYSSGSVTQGTASSRESSRGDLNTKTTGDKEYTEDGKTTGHKDVVGTESTTSHKDTSTTQDSKEDTVTSGKKDTTGHSNRDTTEHQTSDTTTINRHADTPQSELVEGGLTNPSWMSDYTKNTENKVLDKTGNEVIDSTESVTDSSTKGVTGNIKTVAVEDGSGSKDTTTLESSTGTSNTTGNESTQTNLDTATTDYSARNDDEKRATNVGVAESYKKEDERKATTRDRGRKGESPSELLLQFRQTIENYDMQFVEAMSAVFLGVEI